MFGFLVLNKPSGITSRKAIDAVKKVVRPIKIGHTGTLDPLASGVLVVAIGPATRLTRFVHDLTKVYSAGFELGVTSESDDIETECVAVEGAVPIQAETLQSVIPEFVGNISQTPPSYSAVKINGRRAYALARQGTEFEIEPKIVEVHSIDILSYEYPNIQLKISCGSGTYVRSIGRDLAIRLGTHAVMTSLVRESVGPFDIHNSLSIKDVTYQSIIDHLVSPQGIFTHCPCVTFDESQQARLLDGKLFSGEELDVESNCQQLVALNPSNELLAVLTRHHSDEFKPEINFAHYYREK